MIEIKWTPDTRQLRQFAVACFVALPLIAWWFSGAPGPASWTATNTWVICGLAGLGALIAVLGLAYPFSVRPLYILMAVLAYPIGVVVSLLMLTVLYYGVFSLVSLVFVLIRRDVLSRAMDRSATSYWQPKKSQREVRDYFHQY